MITILLSAGLWVQFLTHVRSTNMYLRSLLISPAYRDRTSTHLNPPNHNLPTITILFYLHLLLLFLLLLLFKQFLPILLPIPIHQPRKPVPTLDPPFDSALQHEDLHVVVAGDFAHVLEEPGGTTGTAAAGGACDGSVEKWEEGGKGCKGLQRIEREAILLTAGEDDPFDVCFVGEFVSVLRERGGRVSKVIQACVQVSCCRQRIETRRPVVPIGSITSPFFMHRVLDSLSCQ